MEKGPEAYRTIREVADSLDLPQHVLRSWETRFPQIRPLKRAGGRRYYRPDDIERLRLIRRLLYDEGYTIKGVQKLFKQQGVHAPSGGVALDSGAPAEPTDGGAPPAGPSDGAGMNTPEPKFSDDDLKALREALAAIMDAKRILARARSPGA